MKKDKEFDIDSFMTNLQIKRETLHTTALFWTGEEYIDLKDAEKNLWSALFHPAFGPCYSFHLSNTEEFKFIQYNGNQRPGIEFIFPESIPWQDLTIILHSKNDFPDAWIMNGFLHLQSISNQKFKAFSIRVRKKVSTREFTRKVPCSKYDQETCKSIGDNEWILNTFDCRMPILYSGVRKLTTSLRIHLLNQYYENGVALRLSNCW